MSLILYLIAIILGLALLVFGANLFIDYAVLLAKRLQLSTLLIGIFIIGFGTSAPELLVSALAAIQKSDVALGNAIGSNITNIALILGLTAVISPISFKSSILKSELPVLTIISIITLGLIYDGQLSHIDGAILLLLFALFTVYSFFRNKQAPHDPYLTSQAKEINQKNKELIPSLSLTRILLGITSGLGIMLVSSQLLIWSCRQIALMCGISELVIGLTIVALGTSLPELASSIAAIKKNEHELAVGNVIGSNIFNTLVVIGISGVVRETTVDSIIVKRDFMIMLFLTLSLFLFGYRFKKIVGRINRFEGLLLLAIYLGYNALLGYMTFHQCSLATSDKAVSSTYFNEN